MEVALGIVKDILGKKKMLIFSIFSFPNDVF